MKPTFREVWLEKFLEEQKTNSSYGGVTSIHLHGFEFTYTWNSLIGSMGNSTVTLPWNFPYVNLCLLLIYLQIAIRFQCLSLFPIILLLNM